jgi:hypothetical protein
MRLSVMISEEKQEGRRNERIEEMSDDRSEIKNRTSRNSILHQVN